MTKAKLEQIENFVKNKTANLKDLQHSYDHLQRVAKFAIKITQSLKIENKIDKNLLLACCYLHDINNAFYSPGFINYFSEPKRLKLVLPSILDQINVDRHEKKIIENAVYSSPFSFPFRKLNKDQDIYAQILQDADTLDFFSKEREISFKKARNFFSFYAFLGLFADWGLRYGRKNLKKYLNFPQLAQEKYVQRD
jgi:5'-deoxynucleotidase YfbR-like HD superfamily hydrolase